VALGVATCVGATIARGASAQTASATEGAQDFLFPIGARSVAMGQAVVAAAVGSDAVWWNPALIARGPREVALHITQTISTQTGTDAAGVVVYPVSRVGAIALSVRYLNYGEQESEDSISHQVTGTFAQTSTIAAATFAAPFGERLAFGLTAKLLRIAFPCTGACNTAAASPETGALDLGAQYIAGRDSLITIGAALRNVGFKLQINDAPQADALPNRADFGIAIAPKFASMPPDVRVRAAADVVARVVGGGSPGYRLGGEVSYRERYHARAGYVVRGPTGSGGFTFGLGLSTGKLHIDFARMLDDIQQQAGVTPTFLSLRYLF
jgi:hypothetical protein